MVEKASDICPRREGARIPSALFSRILQATVKSIRHLPEKRKFGRGLLRNRTGAKPWGGDCRPDKGAASRCRRGAGYGARRTEDSGEPRRKAPALPAAVHRPRRKAAGDPGRSNLRQIAARTRASGKPPEGLAPAFRGLKIHSHLVVSFGVTVCSYKREFRAAMCPFSS